MNSELLEISRDFASQNKDKIIFTDYRSQMIMASSGQDRWEVVYKGGICQESMTQNSTLGIEGLSNKPNHSNL